MNGVLELGHLAQARHEPAPSTSESAPAARLDHRGGAERQQPHQRADLEPRGAAVGQPQHVVVEAVLLVPHARPSPRRFMARGDPEEVLGELRGHVLVDRVVRRPARRRSRACSGRTAPSRRCRRPVPGGRRSAAARCGRRRRCCPARGSRPRRRSCPQRSLRLTHQVKFSSSLLEDALEEVQVALAAQRLLACGSRNSVAQAWTGGLTSLKFHS